MWLAGCNKQVGYLAFRSIDRSRHRSKTAAATHTHHPPADQRLPVPRLPLACPAQPHLIPAVLAVLPPHVCQLELATWCEGPLLAALERFKRLPTLMLMMLISGNGARIDWGGLGAAAVVPKLRRLRLDCRDKLMPL